jgi:hypothetical protein
MLSVRWLLRIILVSGFLTAAAIASLNALSAPSTIAVIQGQTEILTYRTFNPQLSSFTGDGLRVSFGDDVSLEGQCIEGTVIPQIDTQIRYTLRSGSTLGILLDGGGGDIRTRNGTRPFDGQLGLYADATCGDLAVQKLPVWGPGELGSAFTVREDGIDPVLLAGHLSVFGKTLDLGWFGQGGALYAATAQPIALPPGGWLWTGVQDDDDLSGASPEETALFGFVQIGENSLDVSLSTETPLLQVIAPGGRSEASRIEIGMFAQIINDPNVLRLQLIVLIFFFLLPVVADLSGIAISLSEKRDDKTQ